MSKNSDAGRSLQLVSPFAHLSGHYLPYTLDLSSALLATIDDIRITVHAAQPFYGPDLVDNDRFQWRQCAAWVRYIHPIKRRDRNWGSLSDKILRNVEFERCLASATKKAKKSQIKSHIHCIESCHRNLLHQVNKNPDLNFSSLCVGPPPQSLGSRRSDDYKRAFNTGRLTFFVETESVRDDWEPYAGDNVIHVPAAIGNDTKPTISQTAAREKLRLPPDAYICLFFGTHREDKDYLTAIEAAKECSSHPYLLFAGSLISSNDPEELIDKAAYENAKCITGFIPQTQVNLLFAACDTVVLPYSKNYTKGSAVLLQACEHEKPVISSNSGHLREFVARYGNGLLYEPGSSASLAKCYDMIHKLSKSNETSLLKGSQDAKRQYSWSNLVHFYQEVFGLD